MIMRTDYSDVLLIFYEYLLLNQIEVKLYKQ